MPKPSIKLDKFLGINRQDDDEHLPPWVGVKCDNLWPMGTHLKLRSGNTLQNSTEFTGPAKGIARYVNSSGTAVTLIHPNDNSLYRYVHATNTLSKIQLDNFSSTNRSYWTTFQGDLFGANGTDEPVRWDGTTSETEKMDVGGVPVAPTLAHGGVGGNAGTWTYWFEWVGPNGNSGKGSSSTYVSSGEKINIKIDMGNWASWATSIKILRSQNAGSTPYLRTTVTKPAGTGVQSLLNEAADDNDLGAADSGRSGLLTSTPAARYIAQFENYLIFAGTSTYPNAVWRSEFGEPDAISSTSQPTLVADDDGDIITGLAVFRERLYVFKRGAIYNLASDGSWFLVATPGAVSQGTICETPFGLMFLGPDGIYIFDGAACRKVSYALDDIFGDAPGDTYKINRSYEANCDAVWYDDWYRLAYTPTGGTTNSRVVVFGYVPAMGEKYPVFSEFSGMRVAQWVHFDASVDVNELYWTDAVQGYLYWTENGSTTDWNNAINFEYKTGFVQGAGDEADFQLRRTWIDRDGADGMTVTWAFGRCLSPTSTYTSNITGNVCSASDFFGYPMNAQGRRVQFSLSGSDSSAVTIRKVFTEIIPKRRKRR